MTDLGEIGVDGKSSNNNSVLFGFLLLFCFLNEFSLVRVNPLSLYVKNIYKVRAAGMFHMLQCVGFAVLYKIINIRVAVLYKIINIRVAVLYQIINIKVAIYTNEKKNLALRSLTQTSVRQELLISTVC